MTHCQGLCYKLSPIQSLLNRTNTAGQGLTVLVFLQERCKAQSRPWLALSIPSPWRQHPPGQPGTARQAWGLQSQLSWPPGRWCQSLPYHPQHLPPAQPAPQAQPRGPPCGSCRRCKVMAAATALRAWTAGAQTRACHSTPRLSLVVAQRPHAPTPPLRQRSARCRGAAAAARTGSQLSPLER